MNFCLFIASSSALIDFWRPTKSGTTMCGKTMMSRSGKSGMRSPPPLGPSFFSFSLRKSMVTRFLVRKAASGTARASRRLLGFLVDDERLLALADDLFGDHHFLDRRLRWNLEHHVEHDVLHDGAEPPRPRPALQGLA